MLETECKGLNCRVNLWRMIKRWLSNILTSVYRGEMEIIRKKVCNFDWSHLILVGQSCLPLLSFIFSRKVSSHTLFFTDVLLCLCSYFTPVPQCCSRKTNSSPNRAGVGLSCPSVSSVSWRPGIKHRFRILEGLELVGKHQKRSWKGLGLNPSFSAY